MQIFQKFQIRFSHSQIPSAKNPGVLTPDLELGRRCWIGRRRGGRDCHSVGVVGGGVAVNPVRLSANNSQRRVSSKNCSLTFGSL